MENRLCIFTMHSTDGICDHYIINLLLGLRPFASKLVTVCYGTLQIDFDTRLRTITDELFMREHGGYEGDALKDVLTNLLGWETVLAFDQLLLANDSCYGPIFSLENVFEKMEGTADFWGLTAQNDMLNPWPDYPCDILPYHIQPYFLVIEERMLHSSDWREFWRTLGSTNPLHTSIAEYDLSLTEFFIRRGYRGATYVDADCFEDRVESNYDYSLFDAYRLLTEHALPFIRREVFMLDLKDCYPYNLGEGSRKCLEYIKNETQYDEDLILGNLIRTSDPVSLKNTLHFDYVLSSIRSKKSFSKGKRIALIAHLTYPDLLDFTFSYLAKLPQEVDIIVSTKGESCIHGIQKRFTNLGRSNIKIIVPEDRGREMASLLIACKKFVFQYDYVCFIKDKKTNSGFKYRTLGKSWMDLTLENSIASPDFLYNVIECFEKNPLLGFLSPPAMYASHFLTVSTLSWNGCFEQTVELAKRLKLKCNMNADKHPFAMGNVFWFRPAALKSLFDYHWSYEDFPCEPVPVDGTISHALERIYPYVAQNEGYYSGLLFSEECASLFIENYHYMLSQYIADSHHRTGASQFYGASDNGIVSLMKYCSRFQKVFIYGAGTYGRNIYFSLKNYVSNIAGFVVSDGHRKAPMVSGKPVFELSEIGHRSEIGMIVAMNGLMQEGVVQSLQAVGYSDLFTTTG